MHYNYKWTECSVSSFEFLSVIIFPGIRRRNYVRDRIGGSSYAISKERDRTAVRPPLYRGLTFRRDVPPTLSHVGLTVFVMDNGITSSSSALPRACNISRLIYFLEDAPTITRRDFPASRRQCRVSLSKFFFPLSVSSARRKQIENTSRRPFPICFRRENWRYMSKNRYCFFAVEPVRSKPWKNLLKNQ